MNVPVRYFKLFTVLIFLFQQWSLTIMYSTQTLGLNVRLYINVSETTTRLWLQEFWSMSLYAGTHLRTCLDISVALADYISLVLLPTTLTYPPPPL